MKKLVMAGKLKKDTALVSVNVNLTHEQKAKLFEAAEKKGLPLATFIRMAAIDFVEQDR